MLVSFAKLWDLFRIRGVNKGGKKEEDLLFLFLCLVMFQISLVIIKEKLAILMDDWSVFIHAG